MQGLPQRLQLKRGEVTAFHYRLCPTERGDAVFAGVQVRLHSPLRLWWQSRRLDQPRTVRVYPDFAPLTRFALFSADPSVVADGTLILTAMLVATLFNGFTGLVIAVFQATEQMRNATIMSVAQGILFIPVVLIGNAVLGMTGVIWSMTVTELLTFGLGALLFARSRRALATPSPEAVAESALVS